MTFHLPTNTVQRDFLSLQHPGQLARANIDRGTPDKAFPSSKIDVINLKCKRESFHDPMCDLVLKRKSLKTCLCMDGCSTGKAEKMKKRC
ncbi:hypothetical protein OWV82_006271 [Melia azedarach]|uniref:Uncharacterized protein n=1 Tax=Melia azedarach TaxID=155640 RepID=A0ACC1YI96_MELAZ|nr:hypothetical protein OWV82_006271 [Melia azedarach]